MKSFLKRGTLLSLLVLSGCTPLRLALPGASWAERTLHSLTLREKIAQMMVYHMNMRFLNTASPQWEELRSLIETDGIGGLHIWFGDAGTSLTLLNQIQTLSRIPILVEADIEYGLQRRFPAATDLPPLMAIAATGDPHNAYQVGRIAALEGRAVGIQFNLSPVVDVNNNPNNPIINTRSFGEDPHLVGEYAVQFIRGLQDHGMLATAKHFPGHGDTETDSHSNLARIPSDSTRLWRVELEPFRMVIAAGVDAVMVAHLHAPDYQPQAQEPASLSHFWIGDILRRRLGFNGAIITDSMAMGGVTRNYSDDYALITTIQAGSDIILQNYNLKRSVDVVEKAVLEGLIPEERIEAAALRMLKLKEKAGLHRQRLIQLEKTRAVLGRTEYRQTARSVASQAITLVKNEGSLLPVTPIIGDTLYAVDLYDYPHRHAESLATRELKKSGWPLKSFQLDQSDSTRYNDLILRQIPPGALVFVNTFANPLANKDRIGLPEHELEFVRRLNAKTERVVLSSFGNPYIIQAVPETPVYLCAYKSNSLMQRALTEALIGRAAISGRLPVTIPAVATAGQGIDLGPQPWGEYRRREPEGTRLKRALPYEVGADLTVLGSLMTAAVADSAWPGAVLLAAQGGKIFLHQAVGFHTYARQRPVQLGDIYDLASLTKVVATTAAVMNLVEEGQVDLDRPLADYLPRYRSFTGGDRKKATVRQVLAHSGGLPPFRHYFKIDSTPSVRLDSVFRTGPEYVPGDSTVYSDIGFILLGKLVEEISGQSLDDYTQEQFFTPLGMTSTYFNPSSERLHRIVPTEHSVEEGAFIVGRVHDENAYSLGGVSGHAGLFSSARDLALFAQTMLNGGLADRQRIFRPETVAEFTRRARIDPGSSRCLGWDSPSNASSGGVYLSDDSYGHTGFTGTSLWIDPANDLFVILLTNAVHPKRSWKKPKYYDWQQRIHAAVYESLGFKRPNPNLKWRERWQPAASTQR